MSSEIVELGEMRAYELTLILRPTLKEDDRKKLLTTVKGYFEAAKVVKENEWGQKSLAYTIKKETSGHYVHMLFESEEGIPSDMERKIILNDSILRHLLLRNEKLEKTPLRQDSAGQVRTKPVSEKKEALRSTSGQVKAKPKSNGEAKKAAPKKVVKKIAKSNKN